ncbi:hypothetical protein C4544_04990 [candidate division WS5 bacterium]|uniref:DUF454 family protein n=1 Tax=candidate division WS5 bacterium TaxID=2093353 RepID=A0A419DBL3_9BACT|nr:MAG: hypothetical protein C4544_04990 [candidate division WS5 bacterium]
MKISMKDIKKQLRQNKYLNPIVTAIGLFFIFLAILGAFLPIIPGFVFLVIGLIILGEEFFLTRWIIKKSPKSVRDRLEKRKNKSFTNNNKNEEK